MDRKENVEDVTHEFNRPEDGYAAPVNPELVKKASFVADIMTIKMNNLHNWYETKYVAVTDTTNEQLFSRKIEAGWTLVLTHVSASNSLNTPTTIQIAIERGGETIQLNRDVPSAADISIDWDGQVILGEGDRVVVNNRGATAANIFTASMSGYLVKS